MEKSKSVYPQSVKEAVELWDKGQSVWSIEMGGIGPGYEQAIQVLFIELLRNHMDDVIPHEHEELQKWYKTLDKTVHWFDKKLGGLSGAQVGAAKQLAFKFLTEGWDAIMNDEQIKDRHILISNQWPGEV